MKKLWEKCKKNIHSWGATLAGFVAAGIAGWQIIDWSTFDFNRDKMKLFMLFIMAAGGTLTKFKKKDDNATGQN